MDGFKIRKCVSWGARRLIPIAVMLETIVR